MKLQHETCYECMRKRFRQVITEKKLRFKTFCGMGIYLTCTHISQRVFMLTLTLLALSGTKFNFSRNRVFKAFTSLVSRTDFLG